MDPKEIPKLAPDGFDEHGSTKNPDTIETNDTLAPGEIVPGEGIVPSIEPDDEKPEQPTQPSTSRPGDLTQEVSDPGETMGQRSRTQQIKVSKTPNQDAA